MQIGTLVIILLIVFFVFIWVLAGLVLFLWLKSYKDTAIIDCLLANGGIQTLVCKCKMKVDKKTHAIRYRLLGQKRYCRFMPNPPGSCINTDQRGNKIIKALRTASGEYFFKEIRINIKALPIDIFSNVPKNIIDEQDTEKKEEMLKAWKNKQIEDWKKLEGVDVSYRTFSTNQRNMQANELEKANSRMRKTLLDFVPMIGAFVFIILMIIAFIVVATYWYDVNKPAIDKEKEDTRQAEIELQVVQGLTYLKNESVKLNIRLDNLEKKVPPNAAPN